MHLADLQDFFTIFPSLEKYFQVLHNVLTAPECNIKEISQDIPDTTNTRCNISRDGKKSHFHRFHQNKFLLLMLMYLLTFIIFPHI